jgi:hypothetical protein
MQASAVPREFSVSDGQETIRLACTNGHTIVLLAASIRPGRQLWCARCGGDLDAEVAEPQVPAEVVPRAGSERVIGRALKSVPDVVD